MALRGLFQKGIFVAWQGNGMVCESNTAALCKSNWKESKALAERHGMCEPAFTRTQLISAKKSRDSCISEASDKNNSSILPEVEPLCFRRSGNNI
jgi:hypothetical protein